ncbi:MAG: hypothetical protein ACD_65C00057G0003, partial [uncultured bacterium]
MFKRNLKLKIAFWELLLMTILGGAALVITKFTELPYKEYSSYAALIGFFIGTLLIIQISIHSPLRTVLREIKLLLTGKKIHKIYSQKIDEIGILAHFFNELTGSLERIGKKLEEHQRFSTEINLAQKIQSDLLPKEAPG